MTLDEAIEHAKEVGSRMMCSCKTYECGKEHMQLASWLEELKRYRKVYGAFPDSDAYISVMETLNDHTIGA